MLCAAHMVLAGVDVSIVLYHLLNRLETARTMTDVNVAAGIARQDLEALEGQASGKFKIDALKRI